MLKLKVISGKLKWTTIAPKYSAG